jgi:hypothetical protein
MKIWHLFLFFALFSCAEQDKISGTKTFTDDLKELSNFKNRPLTNKDLDLIKLILDKYQLETDNRFTMDGSYAGIMYFYTDSSFYRDSSSILNICTHN